MKTFAMRDAGEKLARRSRQTKVSETVARRPIRGWSAQFHGASPQFASEEFSQMTPHLLGQRQGLPGIVIVLRTYPIARLVWIPTQKRDDGAAQFGGLVLQIVEEEKTKLPGGNMPSPAGHDHAGMRPLHDKRMQ